MDTRIIKARELRNQASNLEEEAENEVLPRLQEKYKNLVGTCFEIKNMDSIDEWKEYYLIREIEGFHNIFAEEIVSISCLNFSLRRPYSGVYIVERGHSYLHILENMGKRITRNLFDKKLTEAISKISQ